MSHQPFDTEREDQQNSILREMLRGLKMPVLDEFYFWFRMGHSTHEEATESVTSLMKQAEAFEYHAEAVARRFSSGTVSLLDDVSRHVLLLQKYMKERATACTSVAHFRSDPSGRGLVAGIAHADERVRRGHRQILRTVDLSEMLNS